MSAPNANKNWLLVKFRKWHSWGGLGLSVFILIVAVTGILLNHKNLFFHRGEKAEGPTGLLRSTTDIAKVPISFDHALELARGHYGDVALEKVELKDEYGTLIYKVARGDGEEIRINATTGDMSSKYGMSLADSKSAGLNWAKIVDDLHTGKIFGGIGKLTVDLTSGVIIALTLSGIYLWGVPLLRKRQSNRNKQAAAAAPPTSTESGVVPPRARRLVTTADSSAVEDAVVSSAELRSQRTKAILEAARVKRSLAEVPAEA